MTTLPIENYLAAFPTKRIVGGVPLGPLTIGRFVLLDALGVAANRTIQAKDAMLVAFVLSCECHLGDPLADVERAFRTFSAGKLPLIDDFRKAVNEIRRDSFATYLPPPNPKNPGTNNVSEHGVGWALNYAETLCANYGWTWETAISTPLSTCFALLAAGRERNSIGQGDFDYMERMEYRKDKEHHG